MHVHNILSIGNFHTLRQVLDAVLTHDTEDLLSPAHQGDLGSEGFRCFDGTQYGCFGGIIAAHGVKNDLQLPHLFL